MTSSLLFSLLGAVVSLGGIFIGIGVLKNKLTTVVKVTEQQTKKLEACASRDELAAAVRRSDEMLRVLKEREDEDRAKCEGKFNEFYKELGRHSERITVLETNQQTIKKTLEDIRIELNCGFKDMRQELRELRKV